MDNLTIITSTGNLSVFESTRSLYLNGDVNDGAGEVSSILNVMQHLALKDPTPIQLYVNSDGGNPLDGEMVIDGVHRINRMALVYVIGTGQAMSTAADIVAWGPKGQRFATPRCKFMMHRGKYSLGEDNADAQTAVSNFEEKIEKRDIRALADYTGMGFRKLKNRIWKTWVFEAPEAMENGIIDGIWDQEIWLETELKLRAGKSPS